MGRIRQGTCRGAQALIPTTSRRQDREMNSKPIKIPGPDHPITITPTKGRVTVVVNGTRVANTREALTLKEAGYPAVQYILREDGDMTQLQRTSHQTYWPVRKIRAESLIALAFVSSTIPAISLVQPVPP